MPVNGGTRSLAHVLRGVDLRAPLEGSLAALEISGLDYDSRRIQPGWLFFAFPGAKTDGRLFVKDAAAAGALAVVCEAEPLEDPPVPWLLAAHGRQAMSIASGNFHDWPDREVALTGITGTNGKTTTAWLIEELLRRSGAVTGLIGTIQYRLAEEIRPAANTTPDSLDLMRFLDELRQAGGTHAVVEVSSHALALGRVHGVQFHTAVFTNLTPDHLDFHRTMEEYFEAKHRLFDTEEAAPPRYAVINADDSWGGKIRVAPSTETFTYGIHAGEVRASDISMDFEGLQFTVDHPFGSIEVSSPLVGAINVYNLLAAFGAGLAQELDAETIAAGLGGLAAVPGRFERIDQGQPFLVVVDYAHTPDALENLIIAARALEPERVIIVFGCGGDRDRSKRPMMGEAAARLSDYVVLTSDNPRSEDPLRILNDALVGLRRHDTPHQIEPDRAKAIQQALEMATPGDAVLIAGKGHETYQILGDRIIHFDDREVARNHLSQIGYGGGRQ